MKKKSGRETHSGHYCGVHTLRDPSGYPSGGSPLIASSSVGSESASHCYKSPFEHGFELSRRRKKRPVGTCRNSTYEWAPT